MARSHVKESLALIAGLCPNVIIAVAVALDTASWAANSSA